MDGQTNRVSRAYEDITKRLENAINTFILPQVNKPKPTAAQSVIILPKCSVMLIFRLKNSAILASCFRLGRFSFRWRGFSAQPAKKIYIQKSHYHMLWSKVPQDVSLSNSIRLCVKYGHKTLFKTLEFLSLCRLFLIIRNKSSFWFSYPNVLPVGSLMIFKGKSEYSRGANLSRIQKNSRVIPNPKLIAQMSIYMTAAVFHKINHLLRSTSCLSCPAPPFLLFAVSYVPSYTRGRQNVRNFHLQVTACHRWMGGGEGGDKEDGNRERKRVGINWYSVKEVSPLFRCRCRVHVCFHHSEME